MKKIMGVLFVFLLSETVCATQFFSAIRAGNYARVAALIAQGENVNQQVEGGNWGMTALEYARFWRKNEIAALLEFWGARERTYQEKMDSGKLLLGQLHNKNEAIV